MMRRPHGVIYALLALSVAVNLIGAGYFGYQSFAGARGKGGKGPRTVENTIDFIANRYPKTVGDKVRQRLEQRQFELGKALDELKVARRATRRAMREDPVNKQHVEESFATLREKAGNFQKLIHGAIVDALPDLPEADREVIDKSDPD